MPNECDSTCGFSFLHFADLSALPLRVGAWAFPGICLFTRLNPVLCFAFIASAVYLVKCARFSVPKYHRPAARLLRVLILLLHRSEMVCLILQDVSARFRFYFLHFFIAALRCEGRACCGIVLCLLCAFIGFYLGHTWCMTCAVGSAQPARSARQLAFLPKASRTSWCVVFVLRIATWLGVVLCLLRTSLVFMPAIPGV